MPMGRGCAGGPSGPAPHARQHRTMAPGGQRQRSSAVSLATSLPGQQPSRDLTDTTLDDCCAPNLAGEGAAHVIRNRSCSPFIRNCGPLGHMNDLSADEDWEGCIGTPDNQWRSPFPPPQPHLALIWFAMQCSKICGYDYIPVSWGYLRVQYPLLMPPSPSPPSSSSSCML